MLQSMVFFWEYKADLTKGLNRNCKVAARSKVLIQLVSPDIFLAHGDSKNYCHLEWRFSYSAQVNRIYVHLDYNKSDYEIVLNGKDGFSSWYKDIIKTPDTDDRFRWNLEPDLWKDNIEEVVRKNIAVLQKVKEIIKGKRDYFRDKQNI